MATNLITTKTVSHIYCKAITGIGYAFRMEVQFRELKNDEITKHLSSGESIGNLSALINADIDINVDVQFGEWMSSNETKNITLGKTGQIDISSIEGIKDDTVYEVRLKMNVIAGSDRTGNESFIYEKNANRCAYYEASHACTNAKLTYVDIRDI